ncbi:MAG TPA: DNA adenine methylase [Polyangiaceae bacterium]|nr:DNA adenine methylase [Polyangiaceae bacterium]
MSLHGRAALTPVGPQRAAAYEASEIPRPILKWAGGKSRLVPRILQLLPERMETYYEPFAGGAAVLFSLAHAQRFERAVLSDRNRDLVDVYRAVKTKVRSLIGLLETYSHNRDEYYRIRALDPATLDLVERAARIIYLNRTGYNGLYRVNSSGRFNVPFGRYKDPKFCDPPRLLAAAQVLKPVRLEVADFEEICSQAKAGDGVYFDPPYLPVSRTSSFAAYHHETFSTEDHERLARAFARLEAKGVATLLSNSSTPVSKKLYKNFKCQTVLVTRPINSRASGRGTVPELLVVSRAAAKRTGRAGKTR